jgi:hypothetical protein
VNRQERLRYRKLGKAQRRLKRLEKRFACLATIQQRLAAPADYRGRRSPNWLAAAVSFTLVMLAFGLASAIGA